MALWTVKPTAVDQLVAEAIARETTPSIEKLAGVVSWAGDEHVLIAAAAAWWLWCEARQSRYRQLSRHLLAGSIISALLPHLMKRLIDQERPDRRKRALHGNGIPRSGKRMDAFPSGHAVHVGFLASAAALLNGRWKFIAWAVTGLVAGSRVAVLAHWLSDVAAGVLIGAALERAQRRIFLGSQLPPRFNKDAASDAPKPQEVA
jgi:undecaprenyl-diphosphatase